MAPSRAWCRVYPRVCGGTAAYAERDRYQLGLSPRVRGNPGQHRQVFDAERSIPACAGEPAATARSHSSHRVYPRVCGGTLLFSSSSFNASGLSPRVRGNPRKSTASPVQCGSIPACAGEPPPHWPDQGSPRVYPRVCGGTAGRVTACLRLRGLSPRVRGNLWAGVTEYPSTGSIPACAGEPPAARSAP